jgi:biopolymer transport protein ExbB/TolQ
MTSPILEAQYFTPAEILSIGGPPLWLILGLGLVAAGVVWDRLRAMRAMRTARANTRALGTDEAVGIHRDLRRRLWVLIVVAIVAPLVGFASLIGGLWESFDAVTELLQKAPGLLAVLLAEALYPAVAGFVVGIAAQLAHMVLTARIDRIADRAVRTR